MRSAQQFARLAMCAIPLIAISAFVRADDQSATLRAKLESRRASAERESPGNSVADREVQEIQQALERNAVERNRLTEALRRQRERQEREAVERREAAERAKNAVESKELPEGHKEGHNDAAIRELARSLNELRQHVAELTREVQSLKASKSQPANPWLRPGPPLAPGVPAIGAKPGPAWKPAPGEGVPFHFELQTAPGEKLAPPKAGSPTIQLRIVGETTGKEQAKPDAKNQKRFSDPQRSYDKGKAEPKPGAKNRKTGKPDSGKNAKPKSKVAPDGDKKTDARKSDEKRDKNAGKKAGKKADKKRDDARDKDKDKDDEDDED